MSTSDRLVRTPATHVVDSLVHARLLAETDREHALAVVTEALGPVERQPRARVSSLVEVVAYLGTALVLAAGALFTVQVWDDLGFTARLVVVGLLAAVLAAGGLGAVAGDLGAVTRRDPASDSRRRLGGTLLTGAALSLALLVGMLVDRAGGTPAYGEPGLSWTLLAGCLVGLAGAAVGYRLAPSAVGLLGMAAALCTLTPTLVAPLDLGIDGVVLGVALMLTALGWLVLTEVGWFAEVTLARVLGVVLALSAAQTPVVDGEQAWFGYLLTALVAVAGTVVYLFRSAWPYLAVAVVAVTIVVPEAVVDWTDGGLGAAGAVLVTGVTLLAASLLGAWLRSSRPGR